MKLLSTLLIMALCHLSYGQGHPRGTRFLNFSVGANFANLLNSEAPHKINLPGSEITPVIIDSRDVQSSYAYRDYRTGLISDVRTGLIVKGEFEYFLRNNLSLTAAVAYEDKGIDLNSHVSNARQTSPDGPTRFHEENYRVKLRNSYMTTPLLIRKYFGKGRFHVSGGVYAGYLLESRIYMRWEERDYVPGQSESTNGGEVQDRDGRKQLTHHFDYGFAAGSGYAVPLADNIMFRVSMLLNAGVRGVDRKYNNEYEENTVPGPSGMITTVRSTNYHGFNSNATNISASLAFGLALKLP